MVARHVTSSCYLSVSYVPTTAINSLPPLFFLFSHGLGSQGAVHLSSLLQFHNVCFLFSSFLSHVHTPTWLTGILDAVVSSSLLPIACHVHLSHGT